MPANDRRAGELSNLRKVNGSPAGAPDAADLHKGAKDYPPPGEITTLLNATKAGRHAAHDHLLLAMTYRHGLPVSEAIGLRGDEPDLGRARLWGRRLFWNRWSPL